MSHEQNCGLEIGDRVDHKLFGFGTVLDVSQGGVSYIPKESRKGIVCRVKVEWDDPERVDSNSVMSWALEKVSSPNQRPYAYWEKQWRPLNQDWLAARRQVEHICSEFSPPPNEMELKAAIAKEKEAYTAMSAFWEQLASRDFI